MSDSKSVLGLHMPTDPRWVDLAGMSMEYILTDHAWCEQKAASSCISLIQLYSDHTELVERVSPVVSEEWSHFRVVVDELNRRGLKLGRQRKDEYVNRLHQFQRKGIAQDVLTERLLTCALIEARSCERFRLLSLHLEDESLRKFYRNFMIAEAMHYKMFLELAKLYAPEDKVKQRWQEFLSFEAEMLKDMEPRPDRMH